MDIYVGDKIVLIEFNSFGMEQASGSSLFEWQIDKEQLYGETDFLEIRLVK